MNINRFYDLGANPQMNVYWDSSINTQLEAKDNYRERVVPLARFDPTLPQELKGKYQACGY
ncbi:hypothetical protein Klosneuvirus_1_93 [Klosneuvirus KNV1]|uniref:Uncharacterized protein n=1 Tax=Klosneuvirus KNV1 TaxID=1977640 RepID=A0A1V0SHN0_9VIRU|nr:hypothetical protein Klosneuvirus_1_93 [Klosneuvirus KNV1]